jgi:hypothetical protein
MEVYIHVECVAMRYQRLFGSQVDPFAFNVLRCETISARQNVKKSIFMLDLLDSHVTFSCLRQCHHLHSIHPLVPSTTSLLFNIPSSVFNGQISCIQCICMVEYRPTLFVLLDKPFKSKRSNQVDDLRIHACISQTSSPSMDTLDRSSCRHSTIDL